MLNNFLLVGQQVLVLFFLMLIGVIANKKHLLTREGVSGITNIVLYFVTPCVILNAFQREAKPELINGLIVTGFLALVIHILSILLAYLVIHDKDDGKQRVLRFATVFSNCGFMSLPIQEAVLGDIGVFYGSVFVAVFNVVLWTWGLVTMSGNRSEMSIKKLVLNPGVLGTVFGILIFALQIKLPVVASMPISFLAALNTPVPMIIIGYYIGNLTLNKFTENKKQYVSIALRLVVIPLISIGIMALFKVDPIILTVCTIAASAPTATVTAMFATRFGRDAELGAGMVSVATLLSLITIPILVALAQSV